MEALISGQTVYVTIIFLNRLLNVLLSGGKCWLATYDRYLKKILIPWMVESELCSQQVCWRCEASGVQAYSGISIPW